MLWEIGNWKLNHDADAAIVCWHSDEAASWHFVDIYNMDVHSKWQVVEKNNVGFTWDSYELDIQLDL